MYCSGMEGGRGGREGSTVESTLVRNNSNSQCSSTQPNPSIYFNARSILPKLDNLRAEATAQKPSVICIVESWLSENNIIYHISDSEINYQITRNRHGGGIHVHVLVYIHRSLTWEILSRTSTDLELLALSVSSSFTTTAKHCVSVLYHLPSSSVSFFDNLCTTLHSLSPHLFF